MKSIWKLVLAIATGLIGSGMAFFYLLFAEGLIATRTYYQSTITAIIILATSFITARFFYKGKLQQAFLVLGSGAVIAMFLAGFSAN